MIRLLTLFFTVFSLLIFAQQKDVFDVARAGTVEEMKAIMKNDENRINAVNDRGFTPLILACYRGNEEVALFLMGQVKDINYSTPEGSALTALSYRYNKRLVEKLLEYNADPNLKDSQGSTPIFWAVKLQNIELVELLLAHGAEKEVKDNNGISLFEYAITTNNQKLINLLKNE